MPNYCARRGKKTVEYIVEIPCGRVKKLGVKENVNLPPPPEYAPVSIIARYGLMNNNLIVADTTFSDSYI